MRCYDTTALLYTKDKNTAQVFYPQKSALIPLKLGSPLKHALLTDEYIYIFGKDVIQKYERATHKHLRMILMPDVHGILQINDECMLVYREKDVVMFSNLGHTIWRMEFEYTQPIEDCLIFVFSDAVRVYKHFKGLVFELSLDKFERKYCPIFTCEGMIRTDKDIGPNNARKADAKKIGLHKNTDSQPVNTSNTPRILKKISFSICDNKLYLLCDNKIIGKDLNIYLEDLKSIGLADLSIGRFQCVNRAIFLFDETQKRLCMVSKGFSRVLLSASCEEFHYSAKSGILFVLSNNELKVFESASRYRDPFRLIEENTVYIEDEDEFDESNTENPDFTC